MKSIIALALIAGFGLASAAYAAPQKLNKNQMDRIVAGAELTISGPPGQVKNTVTKGTACNNCEVSGPPGQVNKVPVR
jgi:hypothetical protein